MSGDHIKSLSPEEFKKLTDFKIVYGTVDTPFGKCLIGLNQNRVCFSAFYDGKAPVADISKLFPNAELEENNEEVTKVAGKSFDPENKVDVLLKGTDFEVNVWKQLTNLKKGSTYSYEHVAKALNNPKAIRAVARAVAKNNVSYLIPCHRVISKSGGLSKYKWGAERKLKILKHENAI
ncbi:regulatory protein ada [Aethina tumida]|uniref:regulatory protein ada n=1 Tax=Aethina tumida TaxID=116153 RepID=UPI00096AF949|nr:regulatory protein ada [Aethina tumida]